MNTPLPLPAGVRSRQVTGTNGLNMHVLEAGDPNAPLVLLLHGFPELAWSWRKIIGPLADAGYRVAAPDLRGYGRTTGWAAGYAVDLSAWGMLGQVRDVLGLLDAMDVRAAHAVVGHDFGSPLAAWCALLRGDVFRSVVLMSAPFAGPPTRAAAPRGAGLNEALAELQPPRKHYQHYYATPNANADMLNCAQGMHAFLRAYYHMKSADWPDNAPGPLASWDAAELARLPRYYVMDRDADMAATVAPHLPRGEAPWLTDAELAVYTGEFARTGLQGGLNWYRASLDAAVAAPLSVFAGRSIEVPACFIAGRQDWGVHQSPGAMDAMDGRGCRDLRGVHLLDGAGHWVQQEQPAAVLSALQTFLDAV